jgi:hypothetical protein
MTEPIRPGSGDTTAPGSPPQMPRWVRISGIVVGVLILLFLTLRLTGIGGDHGPGRHLTGTDPVFSSSTEQPLPTAATLG